MKNEDITVLEERIDAELERCSQEQLDYDYVIQLHEFAGALKVIYGIKNISEKHTLLLETIADYPFDKGLTNAK